MAFSPISTMLGAIRRPIPLTDIAAGKFLISKYLPPATRPSIVRTFDKARKANADQFLLAAQKAAEEAIKQTRK